MPTIGGATKTRRRRRRRDASKTCRRGGPYTTDDFKSNDGMLTTVWGPSMWHFLHTMSFNYPVEPSCDQKQHYRDFVLSLRNVLPCGKCRKNLCKNLAKLPLTLDRMKSRATFSKYMYDLHELVNTMLHKTSGLTYAEVRDRYEHFRSRCTLSPSEMVKDPEEKKPEDGCTEPLYGEKSKCVLHIMPLKEKCATFQMDKACIKKRK
jgi:hypothetical protein